MAASPQHRAEVKQLVEEEGTRVLQCSGNWTLGNLHAAEMALKKIVSAGASLDRPVAIEWNMADVAQLDSAGIMLLIHYFDKLLADGATVEINGFNARHQKLYRLIRRHALRAEPVTKRVFTSTLVKYLCLLGKNVSDGVQQFIAFLAFIGENFINFLYSLRRPDKIRYGAIIENIEEAGVRAIPIIAVTSFLIGVVIAYQGAVQLEKFGANIFIVDMIGVSVCRELAPLITAIVIAGRTGSSYTAQIGVMKITEEIDAMKTMGFDPHRFLVQPRIIALMVVLPLMIFFADVVGIFGGMVISQLHMHLSFTEFLDRLQRVLDIKHVWIGIIKGPFFAWLIATIGCFYGFQVSNNTESIGRYTTISVVNAIFMVIACDALFSVILTELGI